MPTICLPPARRPSGSNPSRTTASGSPVPTEIRMATSMAITPEHSSLAESSASLLAKYGALGAARAALSTPPEELPGFWAEIGRLGWLGLHLPERYGGVGFGLPELILVVEQ